MHLGIMLEHGLGIRKDAGKAAEYYRDACDGNSEKACELLRALQTTNGGATAPPPASPRPPGT